MTRTNESALRERQQVYGYLSDEAREDDSLLDDAARWLVTRQCADEHGCNPDDVVIIREERFGRAYEDGRNIGQVHLRYRHPGLRARLYDDLTPEDDAFWIIRPGRICGALYGVYTDGTFGLFMD